MDRRFENIRQDITIAGMNFVVNDDIEIGLGRQRITGKFMGYDRILHCFYIETSDGEEMIIPYKGIKYVKKVSKNRVEAQTP